MTQEEFVREVEKLIRVPRGTLKTTDRMKDFAGWDSLAMIEFVALVDEQLGVEVPAEQVRKSERLSDLLALASL